MGVFKHTRTTLRLAGYDYTSSGAYFITLVTHNREHLFGKVVDGRMQLNRAGKIVLLEWQRLAMHFDFVELGAFVVMPDHVHAILVFHHHKGSQSGLPTWDERISMPRLTPASLGAILGQFKSRVTKKLWKLPALAGHPIWQSNYYEHIIRNEAAWDRIHRYIENNPAHWAEEQG